MSVSSVSRPDAARVYLDHNATTPLHPAARAAMADACDAYGNPSSVHAEGRRARAIIDAARRDVAALTGVAVDDVIFTSGGTEALNMVLTPELSVEGAGFDHLLIGAGEHPAVLAGHRFGAAADIVPLKVDGRLDLDALAAALDRLAGKRVMLALQAANNETGVIQPVAAAAEMVHARGGYVVCDAVQAAGKIACDIKTFGADALAISAHKFGGPKGVGALCFAGPRHHLESGRLSLESGGLRSGATLRRGLVRGGGQERGLRAGTENIVGIAGFGAASGPARERVLADTARLEDWRAAIEARVRAAVPKVVIFGAGASRLPNTTSFAMPGCDAQVLLMSLDLAGCAVSAGSACAAGKVKPSHVLTAMGVAPELAASALRVSLGWTTRDDDIAVFAAAFARAVKMMRPRVAA